MGVLPTIQVKRAHKCNLVLSVRREHSRNVLFLRLTIITGTGLSWYGLKPTELPHGHTTASYVADNQFAVTFTLPGLPKSDIPTQYKQKFFETLTLPFLAQYHRYSWR